MAGKTTEEGRENNIKPVFRILVLTCEWPAFPGDITGLFIYNQVNAIRLLGAKVDVLPFHGKMNPLRYLLAFIRLRKEILNGYDLLHAHHGQAGLLAVLSRHGKVVVTFHGSDVYGIRNSKGKITTAGYILKSISRYVASRVGRAIIVARTMKAELPAREYDIIPCGISLDIFKPYPKSESRRLLGLKDDVLLVLFVGDPQRPEKRFWLANEVVKFVSQRRYCELVLANGIPNEMMPKYMSACDVLLLTSSSEGSPTVVKEAIACNLPVVSVDVGDVRERIEEIDGCRVCVSDDPTDIATALENVLTRHSRINGRQFVQELSETALSLRILQVYRSLLQNKE